MLFHLGALWRLNEARLPPRLERDLERLRRLDHGRRARARWARLDFDESGVARTSTSVVDPLRRLAGKRSTLGDRRSGSSSRARSATGSPRLHASTCSATRRSRTPRPAALRLQRDEPPVGRPLALLEAVHARTTASARSRRRRTSWPRGRRVSALPAVPLARPARARPGRRVDARDRLDLQRAPFTKKVVLTDGGVYDNLGLETAWKRYKTVLV